MEHVSGRPVDLRSSFHAVEWIDGPRGEPLELHVFVDHSVVEVVVDDREVFSTRAFPTLESSTAIDLFAEGGVATAEQVDVWQMNDAAH